MLKRVTSFITSLVLGTSYLFAFAPAVVKAAADTCTWTGGGGDNNFSTGANWSGCDNGAVPESGDALVFDASAVDFDVKDPVNDLVGATFTSITFTGDDTNADRAEITGTAFSLSGNIVTDNSGLEIENNITITSSVEFGTVNIDGNLALGANTLTVSGYVPVSGVVSGTGGISVSDGGNLTLNGANTYSGATTIAAGGHARACHSSAFGTTGTGTTVADTGSVTVFGADKSTFSEPLTLAGDGASDFGVLSWTQTCSGGSGGGGGVSKLSDFFTAELITLDGTVTLTDDASISVAYKDTIKFDDVNLGGNSLTLNGNSFGSINIEGTVSTYTPRKLKIDTDTETWFTMYANETIAVNAEVNGVTLFPGSSLSGSGVIEFGLDAYPNTTVALGNSPGCLSTNDVNLSEATFIVEIAGAEACSGYDQLQVTLDDTEADDNEDVYLFDPVLDLSFPSEDYLPAAGTKFVIIDNDGEDEVQGTFADLPEGETFESNGGVFSISYEGGDGNDVEITVITAPTAPDTGFAPLNVNNPAAILLGTLGLAGAILVIDRKYKALNRR